jgi:hypothetical protein
MSIDEQDLCLELFLGWLAEAYGRQFEVERRPFSEFTARCSDGQRSLTVDVRLLLDPSEQGVWQSYRYELEEEISKGLTGAFVLWLPPGADIPAGAEYAGGFVEQVRQAALALEPGQRGQLNLPVKLHLRKSSDQGSLMSVVGGLDPYWVSMSESMKGSFDLDSTAIHRLTESEEERQELIGRICAEASQIERRGHWQALDATDVWTIQRLRQGQGLVIVGAPPELASDMGTGVRRSLRRILSDAGPRLASAGTDLTALVILGIYQYADEENISTALRGFDPGLYTTIDFICLAADGWLKPITQPVIGSA